MIGLNLPTDNLYKFLALAGVSAWLLCIYLMFTRMEQGMVRTDALVKASTLFDEEENQLELA